MGGRFERGSGDGALGEGGEAQRAVRRREGLQRVAAAAPAGDCGGEALVAGIGDQAAQLRAAVVVGVEDAEQGADDELGDEIGRVGGGVLEQGGLDAVAVHLDRGGGGGGPHGRAGVAQAGRLGVPMSAA